jgi:hypothetical protein
MYMCFLRILLSRPSRSRAGASGDGVERERLSIGIRKKHEFFSSLARRLDGAATESKAARAVTFFVLLSKVAS